MGHHFSCVIIFMDVNHTTKEVTCNFIKSEIADELTHNLSGSKLNTIVRKRLELIFPPTHDIRIIIALSLGVVIYGYECSTGIEIKIDDLESKLDQLLCEQENKSEQLSTQSLLEFVKQNTKFNYSNSFININDFNATYIDNENEKIEQILDSFTESQINSFCCEDNKNSDDNNDDKKDDNNDEST